jgi:hypothetical protein
MRKLATVIFVLIFLLFPSFAGAEKRVLNVEYLIESFDSQIIIQENTDLLITETIRANFLVPKHGIFRTIPIVYSARGKTIQTKFDLIGITDELGNFYQYEKSRLAQSVKLKIGDADKYLTGSSIYVITYRISKVLQRYDAHDELYWNVVGSEWDTNILSASAVINSPYAKIINAECFTGKLGSKEGLCRFKKSDDETSFFSETVLGSGRDFTVVVGLEKDNRLQFPGLLEKTRDYLFDNWRYLVATFPALLMFYFWYKNGRDTRYISENIYYKPDDISTKTVKLFARRHIPFVYHPIDNLSPSEVGTIIDEKVHISDIVAEILELARLGFFNIRRIESLRVMLDWLV